ncbi:hypothetical protein D3C80_1828820 [compost metagenome]
MPAALRLPGPAKRTASPLAETAMMASSDTVMAVPSDMASTESTPPRKIPFKSAKLMTMMAPEHGRRPTAMMADHASCRLKFLPLRSSGSGACDFPQETQRSPVPLWAWSAKTGLP